MKTIGENCSLSELKIGQTAVVKSINIVNKDVKRHLLDMGLTKGTNVTIKKIAPMGDPIDILLRGYELAIRKSDLKQIEVEVIK
ncbi:MAG: ferrous iron transport protein A [Clostridia bacterium]|nr:ferrous iron transport protein A [Clostridia bacterium]